MGGYLLMTMYDFAIVGGGIVGLSTGMALYERFPNAKVIVIEKEAAVAEHQTGHNSGVIHSGIYYKPGSFKAEFARLGSRSMTQFCQMHGIKHDICGKVIVATKQKNYHFSTIYINAVFKMNWRFKKLM